MRKPRDFDAELKALSDKTRVIKERRLRQLGELVIACGADTMPLEQLAGALLDAAEASDEAVREAWRERGAAFFQQGRAAAGGARSGSRGNATGDSSAPPARREDRA